MRHLTISGALRVAIFVVLGVNAHSSQARLVVENEPAAAPAAAVQLAPQARTPSNKPTLTFVGEYEQPALMRADIVGVDFAHALKAIVPAQWRGFADADSGVLQVGKVTVRGTRRPWTNVLQDLLKEQGFVATIDWDKKEVMFARR
ncbi:hypothetical protein ACSFA0_23520 [Variovorax sp. LT1P1]|uniref:hypothetical protein n=1 Tax=Variovorax sp. LT1P1 TaxID=3443730 RepID=UPI003F454938